MDCKIVCGGKECATITKTKDGLLVRCADGCKDLCAGFCGSAGKGCC